MLFPDAWTRLFCIALSIFILPSMMDSLPKLDSGLFSHHFREALLQAICVDLHDSQ